MRYLKQASKKHQTLTYQRRWPTELARVAKLAEYGPLFTMPTKCPVQADDYQQAQAQQRGNAEFERVCKMLKSLHIPEEFDGVVPASLKARIEFHSRDQLDTHYKLQSLRRDAKKVKQEFTLFSLLDRWLAAQQRKPTGKALNDRKRYWKEWSDAVGPDRILGADCIDPIHQGFDLWQQQMIDRGVAVSTIQRARGSVLAVLNWASVEHRLGWNIALKRLPTHTPKTKTPLTQPQQKELVKFCEADADGTAAMLMLMLQGGVMPSEIQRLDVEALEQSLSSATPHVVFGASQDVQTKAHTRRRIVPVVLAVGLIREQLPKAIVALQGKADPAARVNKRLRERKGTVGVKITGHALRHTLRANAAANGANPMLLAAIAGWSGSGLNPIMLGYGAEGLADSAVVQQLADESRKIHNHLMPKQCATPEPAEQPSSNVVPLRRPAE